MKFFKRTYCRVLRQFGRDHDWRRVRKGESIAPYRICRRCGATKAIVQRVKARVVQ